MWTPTTRGPFSIDEVDSFSLGPGDTSTIDLRFAPVGLGNFYSELQIETDDPANPVAVVRLQGRGLGTELRIEPSAIDFGTP